MKSIKFLFAATALFFLGFAVSAQDNSNEKLNLPGDNLNLYAVMNLFKESETLEGFEKKLNAEDSKINNLDLNGDEKIDYIKVVDNVDGDVHTIVLQVAISKMENQDVAVFTVQRDSKNQVQIQLVGDEELYGKDYIIEPIYGEGATSETPNPGYTGNTTVQKQTVVVTKTTYVEVASWPVVTYIYVPTYTVYRSPWYWGYYPTYWKPWSPYYYDYYYGYHYNYHSHYYGHYHHSHYNRYPHYNDHYYNGHRSHSNTVYQRRESGMYKNTYSRPDTRQQGSADFNKKYPNGYRPTERPGNINNVTRPTSKPNTTTNGTRPTTKPGTSTIGSRPAAKPGTTTNGTRPTTKPGTITNGSRPAAKPGTINNGTRPTTKPGTNNPETRPTTKPGNNTNSTRPSTNQPTTRPAVVPTTPKNENNKMSPRLESRPNTQPSQRPTNTPTTRPSTTPTSRPSASPTARPSNTQARPTTTPKSRPATSPSSMPAGRAASNETPNRR